MFISFSNEDYLKGFDHGHDDPMVITTIAHNYVVKRILIDHGSSANILYSATAASMNTCKIDLTSHIGNLIGFSSKQVPMKGITKLKVTLRT